VSVRYVDRARFDVATAGDPAGALAGVLARHVEVGSAYRVSLGHDNECPCTASGRSLFACSCEILQVTLQDVEVEP
jgi:hypothetical protein